MDNKTDRTRKIVVMGLLFAGMILSFFDRLAINVGIIPIGNEFHLSPSQTGLLISIFFISYSLMQPFGGWLTDKFGARAMISLSLLCWSLFTVLTGLAWSFASLLFIRFLFGVGEGPFHPAGVSSIQENFPEKERGRANAFFLSAQPLGGVLGSVVAASMVVAFGWRGMFINLGFIGILVAVAYWFALKPEVTGNTKEGSKIRKKVPLKLLLRVDNIWKIMLAKFFSNIVNYGLISWMPMYLVKVKGLHLVSAGGVMAIPYIASFIMFNLSGWILDKYMVGREKYLAVTGSFLSAIFLYLMSNATSIMQFTIYFTFTSMSISFIGTALFAIILKYGPRELIGSSSGLVTFSGQFAGAVSPSAMGLMISIFNGSYEAAFWFLVVSAFLGMVVGLTIKNRKIEQISCDTAPNKATI